MCKDIFKQNFAELLKMFLYSLFCLAGQSIGLGFTWSLNVSTHTFSQLYNYSDDGIDEKQL